MADATVPPRTWIALLLIFVGVLGASVAVTGLLLGLPLPAAGGTCGPGRGSETAAEALFEPGSIGAGREPAAARAAARAQWSQFVSDCQSAADHRGLVTVVIFVVSLTVVVIGLVLMRDRRRPASRTPMAALGP